MDEQGAVILDFERARRRRDLSAEPWVKKEKVAEHFDVSTRTVYRWVEAGCPIKRLRGGTLRFQIAAISMWLEGESRPGR